MPASGRTGELTLLLTAFALMALLTAVAFVLAPTDATPRTAGSSFSTHRDGGKAAYLVLKQLGHAIERSYDPVASLRRSGDSTMLILATPIERPSNQDVAALRRFIENGGVVLAFGRSAAPFLPGAEGRAADVDIDDEPREFLASVPAPITFDAPQVSARSVPAPPLGATFVALYGSLQQPAIVSARLGKGRIIWCLDDTPISNAGLPRAANVRFLANAAGTPGARTILWDEHYHGQRRSLWSYLARTPLLWAAAQLFAAAAVALAAAGRRRGPIRARPIESRTSPLEFVDTMASLYERAGAGRAAVEAARMQLRRRLAAAAGLPRSAPDVALAAAAPQRLGMDGERVTAALRSSADLLRHGVGRAETAVPIVAELQQLTNTAAAARSGRRLNREHR